MNSMKSKIAFSYLLTTLVFLFCKISKKFENFKAQTSLMTTDTNGQIVNITTTQSNIECFNECIKLPQCVTATKLPDKTDNCLMKSNHDRFVVSPHSNQVIRVNG